jgi:hypothetical protein
VFLTIRASERIRRRSALLPAVLPIRGGCWLPFAVIAVAENRRRKVLTRARRRGMQNNVGFRPDTFARAAAELENDPRLAVLPVDPTWDSLWHRPASRAVEADLRRLVSALERHRAVRDLEVGPIDQFGDGQADAGQGQGGQRPGVARHLQIPADPEEMDRLFEDFFGRVIPRHPSLGSVKFNACLSRSVALFVAAFPAANRPLERLTISKVALDANGAQLVASMFRADAQVTFLKLRHTGLSADGWKVVADALGVNRHLREAEIEETDMEPRADTFPGLVRRGSSLEDLKIVVKWTRESYDPFVRCLRTNESLTTLDFDPRRSGDRNLMHLGPLLVLLRSYNCTLLHINVDHPPDREAPRSAPKGWASGCRELRSLLSRNLGVSRVYANHAGLEHSEQMDPTLFTLTLGRVSSHPYLIQRILRRANVDQFAALMYPPAGAGQLLLSSSDPALPVRQRGGTGETAVPAGASELLKLCWTRRVLT